jgi:hypothetical protein
MVFCGQCGLQLAPGIVRCPRCGTLADVNTEGATIETANADDPTVMTRAPYNPSRTNSGSQSSLADQPPLILRNNTGTAYDAYTDGTYGRNANPGCDAYAPKVTSPGYVPQDDAGYPAPGASYADFDTPAPARNTRGRTAALLLILLGVLLILGAMALFAVRHNVFPGITGSGSNVGGSPGGVGSVTVTPAVSPTSSLLPAQQAQAVIEQYYTDVNSHDYQAAYALWNQYPTSLAVFRQGYAHTRDVTVHIEKVVALSDGTEQVFTTLNALEDNTSGQGAHYSTYKGYYIVGPVNGTWLILKGQLSKV